MSETRNITVPQNRRRRQRRKLTWQFFATVIFTIVMLFPVYWMLLTAILPASDIYSRNPSLVPGPGASLNAFGEVVNKVPVMQWTVQSAIITFGTALVATFVCMLAAYGLSRYDIRGRKTIAVGFLVGRVMPGTLLALPFFILFQTIDLIDTHIAVILANVCVVTPLTTLILKSYFDGIPKEIDDAALVDGCSRWGVLWRMILPLSLPGLVACLGLSATMAWTDLLFARTLLLSRDMWTLPMGITSIIGAHEVRWNELMAAGLISIIPMVIIYWFLQPHLVRGMTAGGVKG